MSAEPEARQPIVLSTINARHAHASLGLRYLKANAGDLREQIAIVELVLTGDIETMARRILARLSLAGPRIVGLGVYIWNVTKSETLARRLRELAPDVVLVGGGPELSHELEQQALGGLLDHVIQGPGDLAFARLAKALLCGPKPLARVIAGDQPARLDDLVLPYPLYDAHDIAHRNLYVEASRGCPFKCEFCLSALDKTAWPFPLDAFIDQLADLHSRGARRFKFVDRTFNLRPATGVRILRFFLDAIRRSPEDPCFAHFELIPDHLPDALRELIVEFPPGTLQFEIGIQTLDGEVQQAIGRRQDDAKALANIEWLRARTHAHLHVDLIAGLPGETIDGFARGYDRLFATGPHEIQIGVLKRLRGAPIVRHEIAGRLHFESTPPYRVLCTDSMPATQIDEISAIARFHDLVVNSGRMPRIADAWLRHPPPDRQRAPPSAFARLRLLSAHLVRRFGRRHSIPLEALFDATVDALVLEGIVERAQADSLAQADYVASGASGRLSSMKRGIGLRGSPAREHAQARAQTHPYSPSTQARSPDLSVDEATPRRQRRHLPQA